MNPLDLVPAWAKLAIMAALASSVLGLYVWRVHVERDVGRAEVRAEWSASALADAEANARETYRRLNRQQENQIEQDKQLAVARAAAARNERDADSLRAQQADTARRWRDALSDSPTAGQCEAAGAAIGLQADVLGRADRRAGLLAEIADAARTRGLKCEADYDALGEMNTTKSTTGFDARCPPGVQSPCGVESPRYPTPGRAAEDLHGGRRGAPFDLK
jgi:hypothetical protein